MQGWLFLGGAAFGLAHAIANEHYAMLGFIFFMFVLLVGNIVANQETMLYVPQAGSNEPQSRQTPKSVGLKYEDVTIKTRDDVCLHAWFIHAPDRWTVQTIDVLVELDRTGGQELGLKLDNETHGRVQSLVVSRISAYGLVAEFNRSHPTRKIMEGDMVLKVNSCEGDADALEEELQQKGPLSITFQRLQEVQRPTILFLHENAGSINLRVTPFKALIDKLGVNILALDYRGFGRSTGTPCETGLIEDALSTWIWLQDDQRGIFDKQKLFIMGRSLGGAVGVALVSELQKQGMALPQGLILENTFTSVGALVPSLFPFLAPFLAVEFIKRACLRVKWETINRIGDIAVPLLFLQGLRDEIVPPWQMDELRAAAVKAPSIAHAAVAGGMHNDTWMAAGDSYWEEQTRFLAKCCGVALGVPVCGPLTAAALDSMLEKDDD